MARSIKRADGDWALRGRRFGRACGGGRRHDWRLSIVVPSARCVDETQAGGRLRLTPNLLSQGFQRECPPLGHAEAGGNTGQEKSRFGFPQEKLACFSLGIRNPSRGGRFQSEAKLRPWDENCLGMVPALELEPV